MGRPERVNERWEKKTLSKFVKDNVGDPPFYNPEVIPNPQPGS